MRTNGEAQQHTTEGASIQKTGNYAGFEGRLTGPVESKYPQGDGHITDFTGVIAGDSFTPTTPTTIVTGTV